MVVDVFDRILDELGKIIKIEDLRLNAANTCLIKFPEGVEIYIEPQKDKDNLLIMAQLGKIPPGHYRKDIFRAALKENAAPYPRIGIFAYSDQSDQLLLHDLFPLQEMTGDKLASIIVFFKEKSVKWKKAIESNDIPQVRATSATSSPMGLFGGP